MGVGAMLDGGRLAVLAGGRADATRPATTATPDKLVGSCGVTRVDPSKNCAVSTETTLTVVLPLVDLGTRGKTPGTSKPLIELIFSNITTSPTRECEEVLHRIAQRPIAIY